MRVLKRLTALPVFAGVVMGLMTLLLLDACARDDDADASVLVAATPQAAIAQLVESNGGQYAGACEQTRSPDDIGKMCSRFVDDRGAVQAYLIGRTFSEFSTWVFLQQRDGGWSVLATAQLDFNDVTMKIPWPS